MDGLCLESASGRRRFLDRLVYGFDPEHSARCNAYGHALRERARLLKGGQGDAAWLASLEDSLARRGVPLDAARRALGIGSASCVEHSGRSDVSQLGIVICKKKI